MSPLAEWAEFYVIVGAGAAALTGLMFVAITLIAGLEGRRSPDGYGIFSTPTVVHFAATLLLSALLGAPWPALWQASIPLGLVGIVGLAYGLIVVRRARRIGQYQLVMEDWLCHTILPPLGYAAILASALALPARPVSALFGVGAVAILFLILGIHNAWDIVTYITVEHPEGDDSGG